MEELLKKFIDELLKSVYLQLYTIGLLFIVFFLGDNTIIILYEYAIQFELLRLLFDFEFLVLVLFLLYAPVLFSSVAKFFYIKMCHKKYGIDTPGSLHTIKKTRKLLAEADKLYDEILHSDKIRGSEELLEKGLLQCEKITEFDCEIKMKLDALSTIRKERHSDTSFKFFFSLSVVFIFLWVVLLKYARLLNYEFDILLHLLLLTFILTVGVMLRNMYVEYGENITEKTLKEISDGMDSTGKALSDFIDKHITEKVED